MKKIAVNGNVSFNCKRRRKKEGNSYLGLHNSIENSGYISPASPPPRIELKLGAFICASFVLQCTLNAIVCTTPLLETFQK